jgi:hypothetical protein
VPQFSPTVTLREGFLSSVYPANSTTYPDVHG